MQSREEIEQDARDAEAALVTEWPPAPDGEGETFRCLTCAAHTAFLGWPAARAHFLAIHQVTFPATATLEWVGHLRGRGFSDTVQRGTFLGGVQFYQRSRVGRG